MKKSKHATLDNKTIQLMEDLNVKPKACEYCEGEYYPYKTDTAKTWEANKFCSAICKGNANAKTPKPTLPDTFYRPSIGELKENNKANGQYFFRKSTMQFFGRQKMSIIKNDKPLNEREEGESGYILKIKFEDTGNTRYYTIINDGNIIKTI